MQDSILFGILCDLKLFERAYYSTPNREDNTLRIGNQLSGEFMACIGMIEFVSYGLYASDFLWLSRLNSTNNRLDKQKDRAPQIHTQYYCITNMLVRTQT
eukprot:426859_1